MLPTMYLPAKRHSIPISQPCRVPTPVFGTPGAEIRKANACVGYSTVVEGNIGWLALYCIGGEGEGQVLVGT